MRNLTILSLLAVAAASNAVLINFDDLANGTVVSNQYAGVTFSSGGRTGANELGSGFDYATATDMLASTDGGSGYQASDMNMLHSFGGWLGEDGDPVITLTFSSAIQSISCLVMGIGEAQYTRLIARSGGLDVATATATAAGGSRQTLSLNGLNVTEIQITPGYFGDWVGIDNIQYELVPEPATMVALGLGAAAMLRRRRK